MFTVAFLTKRLPQMSREAFFAHYGETHLPLAAKLPGLVSYQQTEISHGDRAWAQPESFGTYDALSLYTFASREDADRAFASPEGVALNEDTGLFIDWDSVLSIPVELLRTIDGSQS